MGLLHFALRRPFTVLVAVIALALGSGFALKRMPRDIFPVPIIVMFIVSPFPNLLSAPAELNDRAEATDRVVAKSLV